MNSLVLPTFASSSLSENLRASCRSRVLLTIIPLSDLFAPRLLGFELYLAQINFPIALYLGFLDGFYANRVWKSFMNLGSFFI